MHVLLDMLAYSIIILSLFMSIIKLVCLEKEGKPQKIVENL